MADDLALPEEPLAVSLITGFLGSGKTTLLRYLLSCAELEQTAVVINEFGEIGLDHVLVESAREDMILLNSGCLCCTVRSDLVDTLHRLFTRRARREVPAFTRVVVETTGLADPAPILHTLMNDPLLVTQFRLDGVIATLDGVTGERTLDAHQEAVKQVAVADRLLMTKCDLATAEQVSALEARLRRLNPAAPIVNVRHGEITPAQLFNAGLYDPRTKTLEVRRWLKAEAYDHDNDHHSHHHDHDVNRHDDRIRAFCLNIDQPLNWDRFNGWIEMMIATHGEKLLRLKGLLNVAQIDRPVAIHGVQHLFHPPILLEAWPDEDRRSRLVIIARDLQHDAVARSFQEFHQDQSVLR